jgi:transcriptional regulator with XRE-family HTH domain
MGLTITKQSSMYIVREPKKQKGTIGRNIKFIREVRGYSQAGLARELGISQQNVSKIERSGSVDSDHLKALSKALGVTPTFVLNCGDLLTEFLDEHFQEYVKYNVKTPKNEVFSRALDHIIELYERLIQVERDKVAHLESLLERNALKEFSWPYAIMRTA